MGNEIIQRVLSTLLRITKLICWSLLATLVYFQFQELALNLRVAVFEGFCPPELQHHWYDGHVDWCDSAWWHPFRLASRIMLATAVATTLYYAGKVLTIASKDFCGYCFYALITLAGLNAAYIAWLESPMRNYFQHACFRRFDPDITSELCAIQLGTLGDQRFYYPLVVILAFWGLTRAMRNRQSYPLKPPS